MSRQELLKKIIEFIDNLSDCDLWVIEDHSTDFNLDIELSYDYSFEGCVALEKLVILLDQWEYVYIYNFGFGKHDGINLYPYWDGSLRLRFFHENVDEEMLSGLLEQFEESNCA